MQNEEEYPPPKKDAPPKIHHERPTTPPPWDYDIDCPSTPTKIPRGSILDEFTCSPSPTNVSDFLYHEVEGQNWEHAIHFPLITRTTSTLPRFTINKTQVNQMAEKVHLEFDDEYEWIDDGRAKSVETYNVVTDIGTFCKTFVIAKSQAPTDQAKLADTGANRSMTADLSLLENVSKLSEPIIIETAVTDTDNVSTTSECTLIGDLPIQCDDGSRIYTRCFYNPNASDMIISPQSIIESSETFKEWQQVGRRMGKPGILKFVGNGEEKCITLHQKNG
jgi:hypothetical protein